jgi:hypothetical protein
MIPDAIQREMTLIKRKLKSEITKKFPALASLCRIESLHRGSHIILLTRPGYPTPDSRLDEYLAGYRTTLTASTPFDLIVREPLEWYARDEHGIKVEAMTCENLATSANYLAVSTGSTSYWYSDDYLERQASRWPAHAPLPPQYWSQRRYINAQYQLVCRWIAVYGSDNIPELDDVSPSMVAALDCPRRFRQLTDSFEPAW